MNNNVIVHFYRQNITKKEAKRKYQYKFIKNYFKYLIRIYEQEECKLPRAKKEKTNEIEVFQQRLFDLTQDEIDAGTRDEKGRKTCTLEKIAEKIGVSKASLSMWRQGDIKGIPQVDYLRKIADHYHVNVDWLAGTPGAEKDPDTTLAATGLSADAIEHLIKIHNMCNSIPQDFLGNDLLSKILYSPYFEHLVLRLVDLLRIENLIGSSAFELENELHSDSDTDTFSITIDIDQFESLVNNLNYGRYAMAEDCSRLLDSLCPNPVDVIVKHAVELIYEYNDKLSECLLGD